MRPRSATVLMAALALSLAACSGGTGAAGTDAAGADTGPPGTAQGTAPAETTPVSAAPTTVTVTATDHAFDLPAEVPAGLVTFELANEGGEIHHAQLLRVRPGGSLDDALAALADEDLETVFANAAAAGGVGIVAPGADGSATVDLVPGQYAFLCAVPSPHDGVPHVAKGMVSTFTVSGEAAAAPEIDTVGEVQLTDFAFSLPEDLDGRVAVTNAGQQPHEMLLVQVAEGVSLEEALASLEGPPPTDGPPPVVPAGGMQVLMPGDTGYLDLGTLAAGTYAMVCLIPDPETGQPHLALGMVAQFDVGS